MGVDRMTYVPNNLKPVENLWGRFVEYIVDDLLLKGASLGYQDKDAPTIVELPLVQLVERARQEWEQAKALFNEVADPELVDHAIYAMEAAERKYIYLLKKAQKEKVIDEELYQVQEWVQ